MHGEYKIPGGKLVVVDLDEHAGRLANVQVSGDFFLEPDSALDAINDALCGLPRNTPAEGISTAIKAALDPGVVMYGLSAEAIAIAVGRAVGNEAAA